MVCKNALLVFRLIRSYLLKLRQEDGYETYREREMKELSKIMQNRIQHLQNPPDCEKARKVVCSINKGVYKNYNFFCRAQDNS